MEKELQTLNKLFDTGIQFAVAYGFQILGAVIVMVIGLQIAVWVGRRVAAFAEHKGVDVTLSRFIGNAVKIVIVAVVIIITLGNFGVTITPLIALAGASAFGLTVAIQGQLANYSAGLSIILFRPFVVGNTVTVKGVSGVVEEVSLTATTLIGEDGERISVPNRSIIGEVLINSESWRVVETKIAVDAGVDAGRAVAALQRALASFAELATGPKPQVGVHDFGLGAIVLGLRFWVPSKRYFELRYAVNAAALAALRAEGIGLVRPGAVAVSGDMLASQPTPG